MPAIPGALRFASSAAVKRGMTRLRRHTHDVRAMSACVPTADVSLHRGEPPLRARSYHTALQQVRHLRRAVRASDNWRSTRTREPNGSRLASSRWDSAHTRLKRVLSALVASAPVDQARTIVSMA